MKIAIVLLVSLLMSGCGGCQVPSDRYIYDLACEALAEDAAVPRDATPLPIDEAAAGVGKNAASVDLPYTYKDASGETTRASHTIWSKRVARTWTVEDMHPTPTHDDA